MKPTQDTPLYESLSTEEIARIFAMYLGSSVQYETVFGDKDIVVQEPVIGIEPTGAIVNTDAEGFMTIDFAECKLILKPLSSITDEDAKVVSKIQGFHDFYTQKVLINQGKIRALELINNDIVPDRATHYTWQYLLSKGYAVPMFFALNHPLNGKTLLEIGLAVEATTNNQ